MENLNTFDDVQTDFVDQSEADTEVTSEVTEPTEVEPVEEIAKPQQSAEENKRRMTACCKHSDSTAMKEHPTK